MRLGNYLIWKEWGIMLLGSVLSLGHETNYGQRQIFHLEQSWDHNIVGGALAVGGFQLEGLTGKLLLEGLVVHTLVGGVYRGRVVLA